MGVTNLPELCLSYETEHKRYGRTLNPYDTSRTPGGSSGGESALIASGASLFGIASDFLGSIRLPAAFTGIFGLRTTSPVVSIVGILPEVNEKNIRKLTSIGPMARYARDLPILLKVMSGTNANLLSLDKNIDVSTLRVFHVPKFRMDVECLAFDEDITQTIEKGVEEFRKIGAKVQIMPPEVNFDHLFEKCIARVYSLPRQPMVDCSDISSKPNAIAGIFKEYFKFLCFQSHHTFSHITAEYFMRINKIHNSQQTNYFLKVADKLEAQLEVIVS